MDIQAIIFPKNLFTELEANKFLDKKGVKKIKPFHITENYIRARIKNPILFKSFRTITLPNEVKIIYGHR